MSESGELAPRPFGRRRPAPAPLAPEPDPAPAVETPWEGGSRPNSLRWAVRTAVIAGFVALVAVQSLSRATGPVDTAYRLAETARGVADPETTGSLADPRTRARAVRLDPCSAASPARAKP